MASSVVKLSDDLVQDARRYGEVYSRSVPRQIEYWSKIGRIAEDNPDLTYSFIKETLLSLSEARDGLLEEYRFGE